MKQNILVVGGAGYIGSHMVRTLLEDGYSVVVFDNLSSGFKEFIPKKVKFVKGDLRNSADIKKVFTANKFHAVMHFASSIIISESVKEPLKYYDNNVSACVNLLEAMRVAKVKSLIFSSSAAVYGEPSAVPIMESHPASPANPYGWSKLMAEQILKDCAPAWGLNFIALRYFNVAGAHKDGAIGERHIPETRLIPNLLRTIKSAKGEFTIFGNDYPTHDGSCVRDYIHVVDLCRAHLLALKSLDSGIKNDFINLGNGNGYSVKEVIASAEAITGKKIRVKIGSRRPGDSARLIASYAKAKRVLGWEPQLSLQDIIESAWAWENR